MENCAGGDLRGFINEKKGDPKHEALYRKYFKDIIEGLVEVHGRNQVHRDLKPENVFIALPSTARLGDFGLLRDAAQSMTKGVGTLWYMSPEQHQDNKYGAFSDMWAVGIILYELYTGEHPFNSIIDICLQPPKPLPSHVPEDVADILTRLLDKKPARRLTAIEV